MLRRHIILLIAIRLLDGDVKPGGPLGAFQEEQAISRHPASPSPILSSSSSHTPQHNYITHTVTLTSTSYSTLYIIIRKTWKGMNQTKMEGGTERHLPKTDDWHRRVHR